MQLKVQFGSFLTWKAQLERERIFGMNWLPALSPCRSLTERSKPEIFELRFAAAHVQELSKPGDVKVVEATLPHPR